MGSSAIAFALIAVGIFLLGLFLGHRQGRAAAREQLNQALANEREVARTREAAQAEKYNQMKSDLDAAFKSAAADALRANTQSFLSTRKTGTGRADAASETNTRSQRVGDQKSG